MSKKISIPSHQQNYFLCQSGLPLGQVLSVQTGTQSGVTAINTVLFIQVQLEVNICYVLLVKYQHKTDVIKLN
jgi:hypothetical protein